MEFEAGPWRLWSVAKESVDQSCSKIFQAKRGERELLVKLKVMLRLKS